MLHLIENIGCAVGSVVIVGIILYAVYWLLDLGSDLV